MFKDRVEAGRKLAKNLSGLNNTVCLAIPRGGVAVGLEVAKSLKCPLDIVVARKLGAPGNPELAIGAVTAEGDLVLDKALIEKIEVSHEYILKKQEEEMLEAERREKTYRSGRKALTLKGKTAVLVDDGLATGATMEAAVRAVKRKKAAKIIIAVPVAPTETVDRLKKSVDEVVALSSPESFWAIGQFYEHFPQVSDDEVIETLKETNKQ